jgi:hypothetical protein
MKIPSVLLVAGTQVSDLLSRASNVMIKNKI